MERGLEYEVGKALREASQGSQAGMRGMVEGGFEDVTDDDRWDLTFRMLEALSDQVVRLAREIDALR